MAIDKSQYVNEFVARGIVLAIDENPRTGRVLHLLVLERRNEVRLDISLESGIARNIHAKDHVIVYGYVKAFKYHNDVRNKESSVMYMTATEVKLDATELTTRFGRPLGRFYPESLFRCFIAGKVTEVIEPNEAKWAKITVETCGGGRDLRTSYTELRYYTGSRFLPLFDFKVGDYVAVRLSAFSPEKKNKNGRTIRFQNLIVEDIGYLEKAPRENATHPIANPMDLLLNNIPSHKELAQEEANAIVEQNVFEGENTESSDIDDLFS